jgi:hypothetical protein
MVSFFFWPAILQFGAVKYPIQQMQIGREITKGRATLQDPLK